MTGVVRDQAVSPAERGLRWLLGALERRESLTFAEVEDAFDTTDWDERWNIEGEYEELRNGPIAAPFEVVSVEVVGPAECYAELAGADAKRWAVTCWVQEGPPHKLTGARIVPAPPAGTVIRDARPEDADQLAELERRSPLRLGETRVVFDRGQDYFASARLIDDVTIYVAEVEGVLAGVYWGARQPARIAGADRKLFLEHHVRIEPSTRRGGVFWALVVYGRDRYARNTDSIAFWVSPENHAVRKFVENVPPWSVQGLRCLLPCRAATERSPDIGWPASTHDASAVAGVLNACHGQSELFLPYSDLSLTERLSRDPDQYGWERVRVTHGAVVGVGADYLGVSKTLEETCTSSRRAVALDHGFVPGAEGAYRELLRWWTARLAEDGVSHLAVFTSIGSPTYPVLVDMAEEIEPYDFWTFSIDEPPGASERGVYVDPVYF